MGEDSPKPTHLDQIHFVAFRLLSNGMGGIDWAGLPFVIAHLGIDDVGALINALEIIKTYEPPKEDT